MWPRSRCSTRRSATNPPSSPRPAVRRSPFNERASNVNIPALSDERIRGLIGESAKELSLTTRLLPSGAGHDAQSIAKLAPMGMIFVPSIGGISHSPKEFSRPEDIANGANVLLHTLLKLDRIV